MLFGTFNNIMDWEDTLRSWAKSPSQTEIDKCNNAERAIRTAITNSTSLANKSVRVFTQGSYRNRTNIGAESDVDVGVLCTDTFHFDLPAGTTRDSFGIIPATYTHAQYKDHLHEALNSHFGSQAVSRGGKAFDIHENSYRIDADVVPHFEYRRYNADGSYLQGTTFFTDGGVQIINWPEQNYENGVAKNDATGGRFKSIARALKNLRVQMADEDYAAAKPIPSYLVECLVWNVPNDGLNNDTYLADMRYALMHLFNNTIKYDDCKEWGEVNELKYLFRTSQPWTLTQAHAFISAAWDYLDFK